MGFLDRLLGRPEPVTPAVSVPAAPRSGRDADDVAIERYRYLMRTAPPETIEQVHAEAFARLTAGQRDRIFRELTAAAPVGEAPTSDDPASLARAATRAELRSPGTTERAFGGGSLGGTFASSLLGTIAGYVVASALVSAFLPDAGGDQADASDGADDGGSGGGSDGGADGYGPDAGVDSASGDWGGGGDFGGGDFGGGFDF